MRFLILSLGGEYYAIPITGLLEITAARNIQKDPDLTGFEGKFDFRGLWVPVLDLKKFLKIRSQPGTTLLLVKGKKHTLGLLIDEVADIMDTSHKLIPLPKNIVGPSVRCYSGILRYKEKLALLLNEDGLLP